MTRTFLAILFSTLMLSGCSSSEPTANVETSYECNDQECSVVVWMTNPGNDPWDVTYEFTAQKSGAGVVGELKGSYSLGSHENVRIEDSFEVSGKPNVVGVGTGVSRGI